MSVAPGRNDPCPCGSGKKYKRCCLLREAAAAAAGAYTRAERDSAWAAVGRFAGRPAFAHDVARAEADFFMPLAAVPLPEQARQLRAEAQLFYEDWLLCDFRLRDERSAVDLFLDREGASLRSGERRYLERIRQASLRPYEVAAIRPDEGLDLVDLWTKQRIRVRERAATRQLAPWDVLAARIILGGEGVPVIEGSAYLFPQDAREPLLKDLRRAHRRFRRGGADIPLPDFFRRMGRMFYGWWLVHVALRPGPRAVTPEGDDVLLARATFDIADPGALTVALAGSTHFEPEDDGSFRWIEEGGSDDFQRTLGTVRVEGARLVLEAMSEPRAVRGRAVLEALAGSAIAHRATSLEGIEQAAARERAHPRRRVADADIPPEVQAELVGRFYEEHYRGWLDEPLPALDGRTPREAAGLKSLRPRLVSLLKSMESMSARQRQAGETAYDFGWMWGELGLPRPG
jgi:hypothetical protein